MQPQNDSESPRHGKRVTIKDVAHRAGVSWKTVSNVLNQRKNVRPETRELVEQAIKDLNYRVNYAARHLQSGRTNVLSLAVPDLTSPYFSLLAHHFVIEAKKAGYRIFIRETGGEADAEKNTIDGTDAGIVDGTILSPIALDTSGVTKYKSPFPLVLLGERISGTSLSYVTIDNVKAANDATRHLFDRGCRKILFIGSNTPQRSDTGGLRARGFLQAHEQLGVEIASEMLVPNDDFHEEEGVRAIQTVLAKGITFDGVLCNTESLAIGAIHQLRVSGIDVPKQVKVVGWDNTVKGRYSNPTLTTIGYDLSAIASSAITLVINQIENPDSSPEVVMLPHRLYERESTQI